MTDAFLFDFNGVIVDDEPLHYEAFRAVLTEEGLPLDRPAYYAEYLGIDDYACFRKAWRRAGRRLDARDLGRLVERKAARYRALAERELPPVPGAAAFLRQAAERGSVAVVSGAPRGEVLFGLDRAGVAEIPSAIVAADDVSATKPDPAGYRKALALLASRAAGNGGATGGVWRAVVIEDSLPGLEAARAIGAGCAMLTTSHSAERLGAADLVWSSFEGHHPVELLPLLRPVEAAGV